MRMLVAAAAMLIAAAAPALADDTDAAGDATTDDSGLVLVNAASHLGDLGKIDKLRRMLDARGMLHKLPRKLEATLDGRAVQVTDADAIRDAFNNGDYPTALKIIDEDEDRILHAAAAGDPLPALAELTEWRGLIAASKNNEDEAIGWFRTSYRFNPTRQIDKKLASPAVRKLIRKAHRETDDYGELLVKSEPDTAVVQVDGGKRQPVTEKIELHTGTHLVTITADGRTSYSEMVDIEANKTSSLPISLEPESTDDKAAKLVDATVTAAPGKARLKKAKALSDVTGSKRYLVVEDAGDDKLTVRVYDVSMRKVSKPVDVEDSASAQSVVRLVNAAMDPDNLVDATNITVIQTERRQRWYERWYVWVGVGAVLGGGILTYEYMTREPTMVRGF